MIHSNKQKGFTLIELSIVIVIIGLIIAGVVAGQSIVKQAQLRAIVTEQDQIRVSLNSFKLQFDAVPGDFKDASDYWGTDCHATDDDICNGDGNKKILMSGTTKLNESYYAWHHLALAGLYSGSFTPGDGSIVGDIGVNIPASKFPNTGITLAYDDSSAGATNITAGDGDDTSGNGRDANKNVMMFGGEVASDIANATMFTAAQAKGIDDKIDDGNPTQGLVLGSGTTTEAAGTCLASATAYNLDSTDDSPCAIAITF